MLLFLIINVFIFIKDLLILWKLLTPVEKDNKPILLKKHVNISIQKSYEYTGFIPEVFSFPSCTAVNSDTTSVQKICTIWTLFRTLYTKMQWVSQRVPTFADLDPTLWLLSMSSKIDKRKLELLRRLFNLETKTPTSIKIFLYRPFSSIHLLERKELNIFMALSWHYQNYDWIQSH